MLFRAKVATVGKCFGLRIDEAALSNLPPDSRSDGVPLYIGLACTPANYGMLRYRLGKVEPISLTLALRSRDGIFNPGEYSPLTYSLVIFFLVTFGSPIA